MHRKLDHISREEAIQKVNDLEEQVSRLKEALAFFEDKRNNVYALQSRVKELENERQARVDEIAVQNEELRSQMEELHLAQAKDSCAEVLSKSQDQLSVAQKIAHLGSYEWDIVKDKVTWSAETYRIFGLNPDEFKATYEAFLHLLHPDDRQRMNIGILNTLQMNVPLDIEYRIITKFGEDRFVQSKGMVIFDGVGKPLRMIGTVQDISERKRVEEDLRKAEEFNRSMIDSSIDCIKVIDMNGNLLSMSEGGQRLLEITDLTRYLNKSWIEFWQESDQANVRNAIATARTGGTGKFQAYSPSEKGTPKWWDVIITPILGQDGKTERLLAISRDVTKRKQAEEALRLSEERYMLVVAGSRGAIWDWDVQNKRAFFSSQWKALRGLADEDVTDREEEWSSRIHPEDAPRVLAAVQAHFEGRTPVFAEEYRISCKDGSWKWISDRGMAQHDALGRVVRMAGSENDITERKQAEKKLQDAVRERNLILDNINAAIAFHDAENNFVWANKIYMDFVDVPMSELKGRKCYACWGLDRLCRNCPVILAIQTGKPQEGELTPENQPHWPASQGSWLVRAAPVRDSEGKIIGAIEVAHDITERKKAEDERERLLNEVDEQRRKLEESIKIYQSIGEMIPFGIWICDMDGGVLYYSQSYLDMAGMTFEELKKFGWTSQLPPEDVERTIMDWKDCVEHDNFWKYEHHITGKDGVKHVILSRGVPIKDNDGKTTCWAGINLDITDMNEKEAELAEAKMQAELYLDLMGHDINNYNQVALGYLELIGDMVEGEELKDLISKPIDAVSSSSMLIENVRKLQKAKTREFKATAVDLNEILPELRAQYSNVPNKDVTIHYTDDPCCKVMADGLVKDVFTNLVGNAIKHSNSTSVQINLGLERHREDGKEYCKVIVEDDGPGIPDMQKEKVFARLHRGKTKASGKGLGLYLVRTLVEGYQGRVWVEDRVPGDHTKGARFVVMLPAV